MIPIRPFVDAPDITVRLFPRERLSERERQEQHQSWKEYGRGDQTRGTQSMAVCFTLDRKYYLSPYSRLRIRLSAKEKATTKASEHHPVVRLITLPERSQCDPPDHRIQRSERSTASTHYPEEAYTGSVGFLDRTLTTLCGRVGEGRRSMRRQTP